MGWLRTFIADRTGNAAVEVVLTIPMIFALLFVCFEGGHYLYVEHQVVKGVRDGARFAARQPFSQYTCSTIDSGLATRVKDVTRTGMISGGTTRVAGWDNSEITVAVDCPATAVTTGIYTGMANAPRVTVFARVPYPSVFNRLGGSVGYGAVVGAKNQAAVMGL